MRQLLYLFFYGLALTGKEKLKIQMFLLPAAIAVKWTASAIRLMIQMIQKNNSKRPLQISADFETALFEVCAYLPDRKLPFFKGLFESLEIIVIVCHIK